MQFDFRNGNLRKKYDSLKYTLKKLEQIIYELNFFIKPESSSLDAPSGIAESAEGADGEGADTSDGSKRLRVE